MTPHRRRTGRWGLDAHCHQPSIFYFLSRVRRMITVVKIIDQSDGHECLARGLVGKSPMGFPERSAGYIFIVLSAAPSRIAACCLTLSCTWETVRNF